MSEQTFQGTVKSVEALPNRDGKNPAWSITLNGLEKTVFSLLPANDGDTIFYQERTSASNRQYLMRVQQVGGEWVNAMPEETRKENKKSGGYGRKMMEPFTPQETVGIMAVVYKEYVDSGLGKCLLALGMSQDNLAALMTSCFIAATRPRDEYEASPIPSASDILRPTVYVEEPENEEETDVLEDL